MSLPNLSRLPLYCLPVGKTFDEFRDALKAVGTEAEKRRDWNPSMWEGEDSPNCPICLEPLHRKSENGTTKKVEALLENPACRHCFHRECLEEWMRGALHEGNYKSLRCPTCNAPIKQKVIDSIPACKSKGIEEVLEGARQQQQQQADISPAAVLDLGRNGPRLFSLPSSSYHSMVNETVDRMTEVWSLLPFSVTSNDLSRLQAINIALAKVRVGWENFDQITSWTRSQADRAMDTLRDYLQEFGDLSARPPLTSSVANAALGVVLRNKLTEYPLFQQRQGLRELDFNFPNIDTYRGHETHSDRVTSTLRLADNLTAGDQAAVFKMEALLEFWRNHIRVFRGGVA